MKSDLDSSLGNKRFRDEPVRSGDDRNDFQRDRDIILYTSAFRRLSGITQVISPFTGHVFHNRLTHTLQVAQVGRRLAEKLRLRQPDAATTSRIDPDNVEAVCLAHDLGHPPFGHLAEEELNEFARNAGGFEGNAQSFRIVSELAFRTLPHPGLNLTKGTLRGILKYPWTYSRRGEAKSKKWGAYESEKTVFDFATGTTDGGPAFRSACAEIMDWADDVTYSVHDVEDFYRAGLIPLHLLRPGTKHSGQTAEREQFLSYVWEKREKVFPLLSASKEELDEILGNTIFAYFGINSAYKGTRDQRSRLRSFSSQLINRYINALKLTDTPDPQLKRDEGIEREIAMLKQLTWFYVIEAQSLALQQHTHRRIIKKLCSTFLDETGKSPSSLLPEYYRERLRMPSETPVRVVTDMVASMTESQAIGIYQRLQGIVISSGLEKLLS